MFPFMARHNPRLPDFGTLREIEEDYLVSIYNTKVTVLRSLLFFYIEQNTTLGELRKFFTSKALIAFEADGFIKIHKK